MPIGGRTFDVGRRWRSMGWRQCMAAAAVAAACALACGCRKWCHSHLVWDSCVGTGSGATGSGANLASARSALVTFRLLYLILVRLCGWLALLPRSDPARAAPAVALAKIPGGGMLAARGERRVRRFSGPFRGSGPAGRGQGAGSRAQEALVRRGRAGPAAGPGSREAGCGRAGAAGSGGERGGSAGRGRRSAAAARWRSWLCRRARRARPGCPRRRCGR